MIIEPDGTERYRIEGFLPTDDFLAQLKLGYAQTLFKRGDFGEAEKRFREVVDELPNTDAAAEAQYWSGVAKYKASGDASALKATADAFKSHYSDSTWAKKASIWAA